VLLGRHTSSRLQQVRHRVCARLSKRQRWLLLQVWSCRLLAWQLGLLPRKEARDAALATNSSPDGCLVGQDALEQVCFEPVCSQACCCQHHLQVLLLGQLAGQFNP
jgi:hypothetical protein